MNASEIVRAAGAGSENIGSWLAGHPEVFLGAGGVLVFSVGITYCYGLIADRVKALEERADAAHKVLCDVANTAENAEQLALRTRRRVSQINKRMRGEKGRFAKKPALKVAS